MDQQADIQYCSARSGVWTKGGVDFSQYGPVEVADYSQVAYFEPSESENEGVPVEGDGTANGEPLKAGTFPEQTSDAAGKQDTSASPPQSPRTPSSMNAKQAKKAKRAAKKASKTVNFDDNLGEAPETRDAPTAAPAADSDAVSGKKKSKSKKEKSTSQDQQEAAKGPATEEQSPPQPTAEVNEGDVEPVSNKKKEKGKKKVGKSSEQEDDAEGAPVGEVPPATLVSPKEEEIASATKKKDKKNKKDKATKHENKAEDSAGPADTPVQPPPPPPQEEAKEDEPQLSSKKKDKSKKKAGKESKQEKSADHTPVPEAPSHAPADEEDGKQKGKAKDKKDKKAKGKEKDKKADKKVDKAARDTNDAQPVLIPPIVEYLHSEENHGAEQASSATNEAPEPLEDPTPKIAALDAQVSEAPPAPTASEPVADSLEEPKAPEASPAAEAGTSPNPPPGDGGQAEEAGTDELKEDVLSSPPPLEEITLGGVAVADSVVSPLSTDAVPDATESEFPGPDNLVAEVSGEAVESAEPPAAATEESVPEMKTASEPVDAVPVESISTQDSPDPARTTLDQAPPAPAAPTVGTTEDKNEEDVVEAEVNGEEVTEEAPLQSAAPEVTETELSTTAVPPKADNLTEEIFQAESPEATSAETATETSMEHGKSQEDRLSEPAHHPAEGVMTMEEILAPIDPSAEDVPDESVGIKSAPAELSQPELNEAAEVEPEAQAPVEDKQHGTSLAAIALGTAAAVAAAISSSGSSHDDQKTSGEADMPPVEDAEAGDVTANHVEVEPTLAEPEDHVVPVEQEQPQTTGQEMTEAEADPAQANDTDVSVLPESKAVGTQVDSTVKEASIVQDDVQDELATTEEGKMDFEPGNGDSAANEHESNADSIKSPSIDEPMTIEEEGKTHLEPKNEDSVASEHEEPNGDSTQPLEVEAVTLASDSPTPPLANTAENHGQLSEETLSESPVNDNGEANDEARPELPSPRSSKQVRFVEGHEHITGHLSRDVGNTEDSEESEADDEHAQALLASELDESPEPQDTQEMSESEIESKSPEISDPKPPKPDDGDYEAPSDSTVDTHSAEVPKESESGESLTGEAEEGPSNDHDPSQSLQPDSTPLILHEDNHTEIANPEDSALEDKTGDDIRSESEDVSGEKETEIDTSTAATTVAVPEVSEPSKEEVAPENTLKSMLVDQDGESNVDATVVSGAEETQHDAAELPIEQTKEDQAPVESSDGALDVTDKIENNDQPSEIAEHERLLQNPNDATVEATPAAGEPENDLHLRDSGDSAPEVLAILAHEGEHSAKDPPAVDAVGEQQEAISAHDNGLMPEQAAEPATKKPVEEDPRMEDHITEQTAADQSPESPDPTQAHESEEPLVNELTTENSLADPSGAEALAAEEPLAAEEVRPTEDASLTEDANQPPEPVAAVQEVKSLAVEESPIEKPGADSVALRNASTEVVNDIPIEEVPAPQQDTVAGDMAETVREIAAESEEPTDPVPEINTSKGSEEPANTEVVAAATEPATPPPTLSTGTPDSTAIAGAGAVAAIVAAASAAHNAAKEEPVVQAPTKDETAQRDQPLGKPSSTGKEVPSLLHHSRGIAVAESEEAPYLVSRFDDDGPQTQEDKGGTGAPPSSSTYLANHYEVPSGASLPHHSSTSTGAESSLRQEDSSQNRVEAATRPPAEMEDQPGTDGLDPVPLSEPVPETGSIQVEETTQGKSNKASKPNDHVSEPVQAIFPDQPTIVISRDDDAQSAGPQETRATAPEAPEVEPARETVKNAHSIGDEVLVEPHAQDESKLGTSAPVDWEHVSPETVVPSKPSTDILRSGTPAVVVPEQSDFGTARRPSGTRFNNAIRPTTPAVLLPDLDDREAKQMSRARSLRKTRRKIIRMAEDEVAAAVVIYAAADTLTPGSETQPFAPHLLETGGMDALPSTAAEEEVGRGRTRHRSIGTEQGGASRTSVADLFLDDTAAGKASVNKELPSSTSKQSSRHSTSRHHSSSSSHNRDRDRDRDRDRNQDVKDGQRRHHHHRRRSDSHTSPRSGEEAPRTPKRASEGGEALRTSPHTRHHGSHHRRTPEEQAAHDRRKEERRLEREKERERERSSQAPRSPVKEEAAAARPRTAGSSREQPPPVDPESRHRPHRHSSRRYSGAGGGERPPPGDKAAGSSSSPSSPAVPAGKTFESPRAAPTPPELKRSSTTRSSRRASEDNGARLSRAREEVAAARGTPPKPRRSSFAIAREALLKEIGIKLGKDGDAGDHDNDNEDLHEPAAGGGGDRGRDHRHKRQEKRAKEGGGGTGGGEKKSGLRATLKRLFAS